MNSPVSKITFESEGYAVRDWMTILSYFRNLKHAELEIPEEMSIKQYFEYEDNRSGSTLSLSLFNGLGYIYFEYSPYLRSEHGIMFKGSVYVDQENLLDEFFSLLDVFKKRYENATNFLTVDYLIPCRFSENSSEILHIEIPENYKTDKLNNIALVAWTAVYIISNYFDQKALDEVTSNEEKTNRELDNISEKILK